MFNVGSAGEEVEELGVGDFVFFQQHGCIAGLGSGVAA